LYVYGTGYNDRSVDERLQKQVADYVKKKKPKYNCVPKYKDPPSLI
jgi:hypothetical protein